MCIIPIRSMTITPIGTGQLASLAWLLWMMSSGGAAAVADAARLPDILIYLADDHSRRDCSPYGSREIRTPQLDALAGDGLLFDSAFVASPACAPSRAALLTGLMPSRNGAEENHSQPRPEIKKLPAYLQELGYEVAAFGKVAHGGSVKNYGFDVFKSGSNPEPLRRNVTEFLSGRQSDKPLCLFVGISHPHVLWPKETTVDPYSLELPPTFVDTPITRTQRARYFQEVVELDGFLGELRQLASHYMDANLITAYSSDHGAQFPFSKWTLYDEGIRVPLIIAWPGHITPGSTTDAMVSWVDVLPTLVSIAGGQPPGGLDGYSFADVLRDPGQTHRAEIYATHSGDKHINVYPSRCIRTGQYKYIRNLHPEFVFTTHIDLLIRPDAGIYWMSWLDRADNDPRAAAIVQRYHRRPAEELYRVGPDPYEQNNLADDPSLTDVKADLSVRLEAWMKQQGDGQTVFHPPYSFDQPEAWRPGRFAPGQ